MIDRDRDDTPIFRALIAAGLYTPNGHPVIVDVSDQPIAAAGDPAAARYAAKALEYEADIVAASTEGTRNDTLNRAAFRLGSLVTAGHLDGQLMLDTLAAAARVSGLPAKEITTVIYRAARDGGAEPRVVQLAPRPATGPAYTLGGPVPEPVPGPVPGTPFPQANAAGTGREQVELYPPVIWGDAWRHTPGDIDWVAYPVIERGAMYALYSPAKAGKSLFALDICAGLAAGRSVLGQPAAPPAAVLYIDLENHLTDIVGRLQDMGYQPSELDRLIYLSFPALPPLDTRTGGAALLAEALRHGADLVVIDTVSRVISGGENDADTFNNLYRHCFVPLKAAGITVIRLDHAGKDSDRGMRGSSAKIADVDVAWRLTRVDDGRMRLDRIAARNAHHPEYVVFDQQDIPLRHIPLPSTHLPDRVADIVRTLERLGVPRNWGRDRVYKTLAERGVKVRAATLSEAIRARKTTLDKDA